VAEQVEEEDNANRVVENLKLIGDNSAGLFMLDRELAQRQPEAEAGEDGGGE
jgi:ferritin